MSEQISALNIAGTKYELATGSNYSAGNNIDINDENVISVTGMKEFASDSLTVTPTDTEIKIEVDEDWLMEHIPEGDFSSFIVVSAGTITDATSVPEDAKTNVVYLEGPFTVTGVDKYKEWIVSVNGTTKSWLQIGDTSVDISNKMDKVTNATANDIALLNANGQVIDGGKKLADISYLYKASGLNSNTNTKSFALGSICSADGDYSVAEGYGTKTNTDASGSHAEGLVFTDAKIEANGAGSHAEGCATLSGEIIATNLGSHAEGYVFNEGKINAYEVGSHAEGHAKVSGEIIASGIASHAEGYAEEGKILAIGVASHAEGYAKNGIISAIGMGSHAEGSNTSAIGFGSHAEGDQTLTSGNCSHAEGYKSSAIGDISHAEGDQTLTSGNCSHAEGYKSSAIGDISHAEGNMTSAVGVASHTEGIYTSAFGAGSHAEGINTNASGTNSHSEGFLTTAFTDHTHTEGYATIGGGLAATYHEDDYSIEEFEAYSATILSNLENIGATDVQYDLIIYTNTYKVVYNTHSLAGYAVHAEGSATTASGDASHAEGISTQANGKAGHAEGYNTSAYGYYTHAEGENTIAIESAAHAEGTNTNASGAQSHAEGYNTTAKHYYTHAEGYNTVANASAAHAEGISTVAGYETGIAAHAEGSATTASGDCSHSEGKRTSAVSECSHAEGYNTKASGDYSHAEGNSTTASGYASHAEGYNTLAKGHGSHAEGYYTSAIGSYSHAEGNHTSANGYYSHAEGYYTSAVDIGSHAEGYMTYASGTNTHVQGKFNTTENAGQAFVIGNGTSDTSRADAFVVDWNGNINAGKYTKNNYGLFNYDTCDANNVVVFEFYKQTNYTTIYFQCNAKNGWAMSFTIGFNWSPTTGWASNATPHVVVQSHGSLTNTAFSPTIKYDTTSESCRIYVYLGSGSFTKRFYYNLVGSDTTPNVWKGSLTYVGYTNATEVPRTEWDTAAMVKDAGNGIGSENTPIYVQTNGYVKAATAVTAASANDIIWGHGTVDMYRPVGFAWGDNTLWNGNKDFYKSICYDTGLMYNPATSAIKANKFIGAADRVIDSTNSDKTILLGWDGTSISKVTTGGNTSNTNSKWLIAGYTKADGTGEFKSVDVNNVQVGSAVSAVSAVNAVNAVNAVYADKGLTGSAYKSFSCLAFGEPHYYGEFATSGDVGGFSNTMTATEINLTMWQHIWNNADDRKVVTINLTTSTCISKTFHIYSINATMLRITNKTGHSLSCKMNYSPWTATLTNNNSLNDIAGNRQITLFLTINNELYIVAG